MDAAILIRLSRSPHLRALIAPLCFVLALCLLVITFQDLGYSALPPTSKRYTKAKAELEALSRDESRAKLRSSWEEVAKEFHAIYIDDPAWPNRAAALFREAEAYEGLARRSFANKDAKLAAKIYVALADAHPTSLLADDALYNAAKLHAAWLRDDATALLLLSRIRERYAKSDMATEAEALEKSIKASHNGKLADKSETHAVIAAEKRVVPDKESPNAKATKEERLQSQYEQAKKRVETLKSDSNRSCWRQPWENLEADFLRFYTESENQSLRAAALYRAGESRLSLARCSHQPRDYKSAEELFSSLAKTFPTSPLADDALLAAADILRKPLQNEREARRLLTDLLRRYPKGDASRCARTLLAQLNPEKPLPAAPKLSLLSWDTLDANRVRITLELTDRPIYATKLVGKTSGRGGMLFLTLPDTVIAREVAKGAKIRGSLLEAITVETKKHGPALVRFDLRQAGHYEVTEEANGRKLIVTIDARKAQNPPEKNAAPLLAEDDDPAALSKAKPVASPDFGIAKQLGLSLKTVYIDAGHGGKDPGTYHNNIVEKLVVMDVARTLGRLLENAGIEVLFSRTNDSFLTLSQRTRKANEAGCDLFISIHVNANESKDANGFETYYLDLARSPEAARVAALENASSDRRLKDMQKVLADIMLTARVSESQVLARDIQRVTLSRLRRNGSPAKNNGIKSAPFHVLIGAQMPAVLVELGYCTNNEEAKKLASVRYRELLAQGLAEAILSYRDRLNRQQTVQNALTPQKSGAM